MDFTLKEENLNLKKKITEQDDRTKKLLTKITKLSNDLKKSQPPSTVKREVNKKDEIEAYSLIDDLRGQIKELSKNNSTLKSKAHFFKALHEAETRKRTPYDHIPPRINTKKNNSISSNRNVNQVVNGQFYEKKEEQEQIDKLEELTNVLRLRCTSLETDLEESKKEISRLKEEQSDIQRQDDIDRISLQHEIVEIKKKIGDFKARAETAEIKEESLALKNAETLKEMEKLTRDLQEERLKNDKLANELRVLGVSKRTEKDLLVLIQDLKLEISVLQEEQEKLLKTRFDNLKDSKYEQESQELLDKIFKLEKEIKGHLDDKAGLADKIKQMNESLKELVEGKSKVDVDYYNLKNELQETRDKLRFYNHDGEVNLDEINEALALLRLKRDKGFSLEFLEKVDELQNDKHALLKLREEYASCVQDLEKSRKLLALQEQINKDYKLQIDKLKQRIDILKNEYELRLEEDSRLLDLRGHKIASLESQLKNIVYGTSKVAIQNQANIDSHIEELDLTNGNYQRMTLGQNIIDIHIEAALLNNEALSAYNLGIDEEEFNSMTTFVIFDFFEFETQMTPLGLGLKPHFGHTASSASFQGIVRSDKVERLQYYADIFVDGNPDKIIGKLDYSIFVHIPMAQAVRTFKERTVALNLMTVNNLEDTEFMSRAKANHLSVEISEIKNFNNDSTVYVSFSLMDGDVYNSVECSVGDLKYFRLIPLVMTVDLDRYLRSTQMKLFLMDEKKEIILGTTKVPLFNLVHNEGICGTFDFLSDKGVKKASIYISLSWETPYTVDIVPVVSLLDHVSEASEFKKEPEIITKKLDLETIVNNQEKMACHLDGVCINIKRVQFDMSLPLVKNLLQGVIQVFVSFDFLDLPAETLETESCALLPSGDFIGMDHSTNSRILISFRQFLESGGEIVFSVVSEPPPSRPDDPCIDLCAAPWTPRECTDGLVSLDLVAENGIKVGKFEFEWMGSEFIKSLNM